MVSLHYLTVNNHRLLFNNDKLIGHVCRDEPEGFTSDPLQALINIAYILYTLLWHVAFAFCVCVCVCWLTFYVPLPCGETDLTTRVQTCHCRCVYTSLVIVIMNKFINVTPTVHVKLTHCHTVTQIT